MLTDPAALSHVARYRAGVARVEEALAGADDASLDRRGPGPEAWCSRQVVHHLADSETNSYVRLRRLLAVLGRHVGDTRLIGGLPPRAVWGRRWL